MTYNEARKNSSIKYNRDHQKRIPLNVRNDDYELIKIAASTAGESVNTYIKKAIAARMLSDGMEPITVRVRHNDKTVEG